MWLAIVIGIIALATAHAESIYDKEQWEKNKDDKPSSTIYRTLLMILYGLVYWLLIPSAGLLEGAIFSSLTAIMFMAIFDYTLNIHRWKSIPKIYNYRKHHNMSYSKIWWGILGFLHKLSWHGGDTKNLKWYQWDKMFARIPWQGELLFKVIAVWVSIYYLAPLL